MDYPAEDQQDIWRSTIAFFRSGSSDRIRTFRARGIGHGIFCAAMTAINTRHLRLARWSIIGRSLHDQDDYNNYYNRHPSIKKIRIISGVPGPNMMLIFNKVRK